MNDDNHEEKTNDAPSNEGASAETTAAQPRPVCGIVMPIGEIDGCSVQHWIDVKSILSEAIASAGFEPRLVSTADESGVIQKRIIQNLYENPLVVCDVSAKNPNVMFELGLRLAFDKATIVVKDDVTGYSFDSSPIEHVGYPRSLEYYPVLDFKRRLTAFIQGTYKASQNDSYTTFLKHFGPLSAVKIEVEEISRSDEIMQRLDELTLGVSRLERVRQNEVRTFRELQEQAASRDSLNAERLIESAVTTTIAQHKSAPAMTFESLAFENAKKLLTDAGVQLSDQHIRALVQRTLVGRPW